MFFLLFTYGFPFFFHIVVVDAIRAYALFAFGNGVSSLALLLEDKHYDALTSLPAFLGKGYFYPHCLKGYDNLANTPAPTTKQTIVKPAFKTAVKTTLNPTNTTAVPAFPYEQCHHLFYSPQCLAAHQSKAI